MTRHLIAAVFVGMALLLPSAADAQTETVEYYGTDVIGSIRIIFDANGATVARQDYGPFGKPLFPVARQQTRGLGGQESDAETDQMYFHARLFVPRIARFSTPDPITGSLGDSQRWNRYAYARNSPLSHVDFLGLDECGMTHGDNGWRDTCKFHSGSSATSSTDSNPGKVSSTSYDTLFLLTDGLGPSGGRRGFGGLFQVNGRRRTSGNTSTDSHGDGEADKGKDKKNGDGNDDHNGDHCTLPAEGRWLPDYMTFQVSGGAGIGLTGQLSIDMNANVYLALGPNVGKSLVPVSGAVSFGWLDGSGPLPAAQVTNFMTKWTRNYSAAAALSAGKTTSPGNGWATEVGLGTPQVGVSATYAWRLGNLNTLAGGDVCK